MTKIFHWLRILAPSGDPSNWQDVLESAMRDGCADEKSLEQMLDHLGRTA